MLQTIAELLKNCEHEMCMQCSTLWVKTLAALKIAASLVSDQSDCSKNYIMRTLRACPYYESGLIPDQAKTRHTRQLRVSALDPG